MKRRHRIIATLLCVYCLALGVRLWWGWLEDHREDWRGRLPGAVANPEAWRLVCEMRFPECPELEWWVEVQGDEEWCEEDEDEGQEKSIWRVWQPGWARWWRDAEDARDESIRAARAALVAQSRAAIPVLLENLDREDISGWYRVSAFHVIPISVGLRCEGVLETRYDLGGCFYWSRKNAAGDVLLPRDYFDFRAGLCGDDRCRPSEWWERNRHRTDAEIREMIRQWYIARETAFGFENEDERKRILGAIDESFRRMEGEAP